MDDLKKFIDENKEDFDRENLPDFHKDRFFLKLQKEREAARRRYIIKRVRYYFAAASIAAFLILTPLLYWNRVYTSHVLDAADYIGMLEEKSESVSKMAKNLNPQDKNMVLSTLEQLTFEAVPFETQLSADIRNGERKDLVKRYYSPKIEGVDKLRKYVKQLLIK